MFLVALVACGDDGGGGAQEPSGPAPLGGTLAYVVSECRVEADLAFVREKLVVQQGERSPVTIREVLAPGVDRATPLPGLPPVGAACQLYGLARGGVNPFTGFFQLLAVSPDGSHVAFEVTDDVSLLDPDFLAPEEEGIFVVRADGSDLRRLGPASSVRSFGLDPLVEAPFAGFNFSPNGRLLVFVDQGPGPAGEDALQVWIQDIVTGRRTQITHLPNGPLPQVQRDTASTCCASFLDDDTILFRTTVRLDDLSEPPVEPPEPRARAPLAIGTNGEGLREMNLQRIPIASETPELLETFVITGEKPAVAPLGVDRGYANEISCPVTRFLFTPLLVGETRSELFYLDGDNLLQLTNFRLNFTAQNGGATLSADGTRAFFTAAGNHLFPQHPVGWTIVDEDDPRNNSEWLVVDGRLLQLNNNLGTFAVADGTLSFVDYTLALTFESRDDDAIGVTFRYQDPNNYYLVSLDNTEGGASRHPVRRLTKKVAGTVTVLAEDDFAYQLFTPYALSVTASGDRLQVFQDGARVFDVTDADLTTGGIGLYTFVHSGAFFDDVVVTDAGGNGGTVLFRDDFEYGDVVGTNPTGNCQLFSISVTGDDLRQLTDFREVERSTAGCAPVASRGCGCTVGGLHQDRRTETLIFSSSCDPFGTGYNGRQIFAMRPDGTGLRQLTHTRGTITEPDRTLVVEMPGLYTYSSVTGQ